MHVHRPIPFVPHDVEVSLPPTPRRRRGQLGHRIFKVVGVSLDQLARAIHAREPVAPVPVLPLAVFSRSHRSLNAVESLQSLAGFSTSLLSIKPAGARSPEGL